MSQGKRPGGLTALAVINFVFGAFALLGIFGLVFLLSAPALMGTMRDKMEQEGASEQELEKMDRDIAEVEKSFDEIGGRTGVFVHIGLSLLSSFLLIASGIGYLKQRRVLGRGFGNAYGILGVIGNVYASTTMGFNFGVMFGFLYPVLTLILINTTFKDDLVN